MSVTSYRHETPVLAKPLKLVHVDEDIVVLDKPCSLPVSGTTKLNYALLTLILTLHGYQQPRQPTVLTSSLSIRIKHNDEFFGNFTAVYNVREYLMYLAGSLS